MHKDSLQPLGTSYKLSVLVSNALSLAETLPKIHSRSSPEEEAN